MRAVNLIPADKRRGASVGLGRSQGGAYALLAVFGVFALFAYLYGSAQHEISHDQGEVASLNAAAQRAQADAGVLASYEAFNATREKRQKAVEALVDSRFDWAHAMHEFGRVLPGGVTINSLSGAIGAAAAATSVTAAPAAGGASASVTAATPPGSVPTFTVGGCARSQDEVAQTLQRLRLIDGVKEVTLQSASATESASSTGSAASAAAANGACDAGASFTAAVVFAPLPAATAYPTAKTVSDPAVPADPKASGRTK